MKKSLWSFGESPLSPSLFFFFFLFFSFSFFPSFLWCSPNTRCFDLTEAFTLPAFPFPFFLFPPFSFCDPPRSSFLWLLCVFPSFLGRLNACLKNFDCSSVFLTPPVRWLRLPPHFPITPRSSFFFLCTGMF